MTEERFDLVFDGRLATGYSQAQVRQNMAELFSLGETQLATLFSGRPVVLKRSLDKGQAIRFRNRLAQAGALGLIRPHQATDGGVQAEEAPAAAASPQVAPRPALAPKPAQPKAGEPKPLVEKAAVAKPATPSPVVAKPVAKPAVADQSAAVKPVAAAPASAAPVSTAPVSEATTGEVVTCPRCGHEQPRADSCGACRMDLRLHLQRLEKRARVVAAARRS